MVVLTKAPKERHGEDMRDDLNSSKSKADFIRLAGFEPELVEFLTEFDGKSDQYFSMPLERLRKIESQMDTIIASFGKS